MTYETQELEVKDLDSQIVYRVADGTLPIIRKKGMDSALRPIFEITFIGKEKP